MEANDDVGTVNWNDFVELQRHRRDISLLGIGASEIAIPPRALIRRSGYGGYHSTDSLSISETETAVASNSSLRLEGRSRASGSVLSNQSDSITSTPTHALPLPSDQEQDTLFVGAAFQGIDTVDAIPQQIILDLRDSETREHGSSEGIIDDQVSTQTPGSSFNVNNDTPDRAPGVSEGSERRSSLHGDDLDEIYRLIARHTRPVELYIPTVTGVTSWSGSTAAGSDEPEDVDSTAPLLPVHNASDNDNGDLVLHVPNDPAAEPATPSLDQDTASEDIGAAATSATATSSSAAHGHCMQTHDHNPDHGASLAQSNTI